MFSGILWFFVEVFRIGFEYLGIILLFIFNFIFGILDKLTFSFMSDTFLNKKAEGRNSFRNNIKITKEKIKKSQIEVAVKNEMNLRLVKSYDLDLEQGKQKKETRQKLKKIRKDSHIKKNKEKKIVSIEKKSQSKLLKSTFFIVISPFRVINFVFAGIFKYVLIHLQPIREEDADPVIERKDLIEEYLRDYERKKRYYR